MALKFANKIVVFIDILGFGTLVEQAALDDRSDEAERLEKALNVIQLLGPVDSDDEAQSGLEELNVQIFSDSVILSCAPNPSGLKELFKILSLLFVQLMIEGVWIRGGVSFGKFSGNPVTPCGPAVNSAYQIESKIAGFPRLALSASMVEFCRQNDPEILDSIYVQRDEDGVFAVSPLKFATEDHEKFGMDIRHHATEICGRLNDALEQIVDRPDHFRKIMELADRWNLVADHKKGFFTESHRTKGYIDFVDEFNSTISFDIDALPTAP
jgi:hypothetical protein